MKFLSITGILKRFKRSRLRRIMRGYRFLKKTNQLGLIAAVKNELTNTPFSRINHNASRLLFGAGAEKAELIIRQYLLTKIGGLSLNKALLYSLGTKGSAVIYPLPRLWQNVVAKHGFSVAKIRCSLFWAGYVGFFWGYGVLFIAKYLCISLWKKFCFPHSFVPGRYAYFMRLTAGNLPQSCSDSRSHDIITWYAYWEGKAERLATLCHNVINSRTSVVADYQVMFLPHSVPLLDNLSNLVLFFVWVLTAVLSSALDLIRGHWWHALVLKESTEAAMVRFQTSKKIACDYLFHNSCWLYRPLWTYEAEKKGSRIIFYFYSTNCETFKLLAGYPSQENSWQIANWPLYLVWDEYQADFVRRAVDKFANIKVVGQIWFQHSFVEIPKLPAGFVAVFDVQPHRSSRYQMLGALQEYYVPKVANQFLLDIYTVTQECKKIMVHKRKRNIGKMLHPKYAAIVKSLSGNNDMFSIEPNISAIKVIENCFAVISMPFTSTALIGKELGKPSVYYDPSGKIQKDDRAAHGISVLCGKNELRDWLTGVCL